MKVGIIGATGLVGQRFISLLADHPWFEISELAASPRSAGIPYEEAVAGRWKISTTIPDKVRAMKVRDAADTKAVCENVDLVFCAVDLDKESTRQLEEAYAKNETPLISNNSAHRMNKDVPMVIPEINSEHFQVIEQQRKRLGTRRGFIAVKPNCSLQSYVPAIHALKDFGPERIMACTYQAISGAGKTFHDWPEMVDNVIPYISGEEEKSESEPLKIWGTLTTDGIITATRPRITAQCIRVPVADGHLAAVFVSFKDKPSKDQILNSWANFQSRPQQLKLPSAPTQFLTYMQDQNRPQTRLDRDLYNGMGISIGRLREDSIFDYKFISLSHNAIRGAAGGAVLIAEMLKTEGYLE